MNSDRTLTAAAHLLSLLAAAAARCVLVLDAFLVFAILLHSVRRFPPFSPYQA